MSVALPVIENPQKVTRPITLSVERSERLRRIAQIRLSSEDEVVARALDLYFQLTDFFEVADEHHEWHRLSELSLRRVWENEADAAYDDWRVLYGIPEG